VRVELRTYAHRLSRFPLTLSHEATFSIYAVTSGAPERCLSFRACEESLALRATHERFLAGSE